MSTVAEIKAAIDKLSPRERCELNALLRGWDQDAWDRQMAADAEPGGKLDKLRQAAEADAQGLTADEAEEMVQGNRNGACNRRSARIL